MLSVSRQAVDVLNVNSGLASVQRGQWHAPARNDASHAWMEKCFKLWHVLDRLSLLIAEVPWSLCRMVSTLSAVLGSHGQLSEHASALHKQAGSGVRHACK